jgi:hypothetical protein
LRFFLSANSKNRSQPRLASNDDLWLFQFSIGGMKSRPVSTTERSCKNGLASDLRKDQCRIECLHFSSRSKPASRETGIGHSTTSEGLTNPRFARSNPEFDSLSQQFAEGARQASGGGRIQ